MKGKQKHIDRLKMLANQSRISKAASMVAYRGADLIRAHAHREISRGSGSLGRHVASKPGEFPNRDTGDLQNDITAQLETPLVATVTSSAPYAAALQFGTSKMAARPYMRPSRDAKVAEINKLFAEAVTKIIQRSGK